MAEDNNKNTDVKQLKGVPKLISIIQNGMDSLYKNVNSADPGIDHTIDYMKTRMHNAIDNIISNNMANTGQTNISALYQRLNQKSSKGNNTNTIGDIENELLGIFSNDQLMTNIFSLYSSNMYIKELDLEYDTVCKYLPLLEEAINIRKDAILCADTYSKDPIKISVMSSDSNVASDSKVKMMKEKYDLNNLYDRIEYEVDKYGEAYVYCVNYNKAISRLLNTKGEDNNGIQSDISGNRVVNEAFVSYNEDCSDYTIHHNPSKQFLKNNKGIIIEFSNGIAASVINECRRSRIIQESTPAGLNEASILGKNIKIERDREEIPASKQEKPSTTKNNKLYELDKSVQDGLATGNYVSEKQLRARGCAVKLLPRELVRPLYIENTCLGYIYIECDDQRSELEKMSFTSTLSSLKPGSAARRLESSNAEENMLIKRIASSVSAAINKEFVNLNADLSKEIYLILKYNRDMNPDGKFNRLRISFIPPEDMVHCYYRKDPKTNRGISLLQKGLFPAKLYTWLYITNALGIITRGYDHHVYYVKQNVDTNIAAVLLNTINQIKQSNMGLRQIENLNNVLNITGRFNDYVIPESASGDAPIRMETMEGQNIEIENDFMQQLKEMAVNPTTVPIEVIQATQQVDYATKYSMSNAKFMKSCMNDQSKCMQFLGRITTIIYNSEFNDDAMVEVQLAPPMYLNLVSFDTVQNNINSMVEFIAAAKFDPDNDDAKIIGACKSALRKYLSKSLLPYDTIDNIINLTKMKYARDGQASSDSSSDSSSEY